MMNIRKHHRPNTGKTIILGLGTALALGNTTQAKFDGFYAGASLGYLHQNTDIKANQNPKNPNAHVNNTHSQRRSPTAEFFFGWGKVFQSCFYGGLEGKVDFAGRGGKKVAEDTNFVYRAGRKGLGVALLARLGYLVTPHTLIYGSVGVKKIQLKYNFFEKLDKVSAPFSKRSMHLLTEIGVETLLTTSKNLAFRVSYSFTPKRSLTQNTTNFPINHVYREHGVFRAKTAEHILKAGLTYQF